MPRPRSDLTGKRFGILTAVRPTEQKNHNRTVLWECKCDCGNTKLIPSTKLKNNEVSSCGCRERHRPARTERGESGLNSLIKGYKWHAKNRGHEWELTKRQFKELTTQDCFYCGKKPENITYGSLGRRKEYGAYISNGVDRVDNTQGYTVDNVVACCKTCNRAKGTQTFEDYTDWLHRVATFLSPKL